LCISKLCGGELIYQTASSISIANMQNDTHANPSTLAKARMNMKAILEKKKRLSLTDHMRQL